MIEGIEACDTNNLGGLSCSDIDATKYIDAGKLKCTGCEFDTSECVECTDDNYGLCKINQICVSGRCSYSNPDPFCGDGILNTESEECDGEVFKDNLTTCAEHNLAYISGKLMCNSACQLVEANCAISSVENKCDEN